MLELQALAQIAQIPVEVQVLHALNTASLIGVAPLSVAKSADARRPRSSEPLTGRNEGGESLILRALHRRNCRRRRLHSRRSLLTAIFSTPRRTNCLPRKTFCVCIQKRPGARHGTPGCIHPNSHYGYQQIYLSPRRSLAVSAPFQRLHTLANNLRDCHQPP